MAAIASMESSPTQPGLNVIPLGTIYSPIAQLIHHNSFSQSRDSMSKKRDQELGEDHDSSIPEKSTKIKGSKALRAFHRVIIKFLRNQARNEIAR